MKPCDCESLHDVATKLNENGVSYNNWGILVLPLSVRIDNGTFMLKIPMHIFKRFAEWYLEDQKAKGKS